MQKLISLKKEVFFSFKQHPVLTTLSIVCSAYVASLIALAMVVTFSPQSRIGILLENIF